MDAPRLAFLAVAWIPAAVLGLAAALAPASLVPIADLIAALAFVAFGLRHGALDHQVIRNVVHVAPVSTIVAFYAAAVAICALTFAAAPAACTAVLVAITFVHFGCADVAFFTVPSSRTKAPAYGWSVGAAALVPLLAHATAWDVPLPLRPLAGGAVAALAAIEVLRRVRAGGTLAAIDLLVAAGTAALLPLPQAFFIYFGCWHSPRHVERLIELMRTERPRTFAAAFADNVRDTIPFSLVALAGIAAAAWSCCSRGGSCAAATLATGSIAVGATFALATPHVAVTAMWDWRERKRYRF